MTAATPTCPRCATPVPAGARACSNCGADVSGQQGQVATAYAAAATSARMGVTQGSLQDALQRATVGEYEVKGELGHGGMASVFLAHDIALDRKVAIKVMSPALLQHGRHGRALQTGGADRRVPEPPPHHPDLRGAREPGDRVLRHEVRRGTLARIGRASARARCRVPLVQAILVPGRVSAGIRAPPRRRASRREARQHHDRRRRLVGRHRLRHRQSLGEPGPHPDRGHHRHAELHESRAVRRQARAHRRVGSVLARHRRLRDARRPPPVPGGDHGRLAVRARARNTAARSRTCAPIARRRWPTPSCGCSPRRPTSGGPTSSRPSAPWVARRSVTTIRSALSWWSWPVVGDRIPRRRSGRRSAPCRPTRCPRRRRPGPPRRGSDGRATRTGPTPPSAAPAPRRRSAMLFALPVLVVAGVAAWWFLGRGGPALPAASNPPGIPAAGVETVKVVERTPAETVRISGAGGGSGGRRHPAPDRAGQADESHCNVGGAGRSIGGERLPPGRGERDRETRGRGCCRCDDRRARGGRRRRPRRGGPRPSGALRGSQRPPGRGNHFVDQRPNRGAGSSPPRRGWARRATDRGRPARGRVRRGVQRQEPAAAPGGLPADARGTGTGVGTALPAGARHHHAARISPT